MHPATFSLALCMLSGVALRVNAEAFATADQALWIDRHNYFRMTALPFAAGNMLRVKWSDALATQAEADASACAAKTSAGVNAALVASTGSPVDAAFKTWVVDTAMTVFPTLAAPKTAGEPVGTGVYNSYSQVVWSSTNEVGCAKATCGTQVGVACRYAPAGNDGTSPWYVHGSAGSACPSPLVSKVGLCVTSVDDPSYNAIAPIADGQNAYDVFKDFIPNMQKALAGQAQTTAADASTAPVAPAAPGAATASVTAAPAGSAAGSAAPAAAGAATAAPGAASTAPGTAPAAPGAATTAPAAAAAANGTAPATTDATTTAAPATGGATPVPSVTKIVDGKVYVRVPKTTTPAAGAGSAATAASSETPAASAAAATTDGATPEPSVTKIVDGKVMVRVPKTTAPAAGAAGSAAGATPSAGSAAAGATPEPSVTKIVDGKVMVRVKKTDANDVVGTVQPSSGTGTTFTNQATTAPGAAAGAAAASTAPTAAAAKSTAAGSTAPSAIGANNKSGDADGEEKSFSAAGVAGVIVIGCVAVAGIAVFVSYRKNQQRQRDIMQNGGIHVL